MESIDETIVRWGFTSLEDGFVRDVTAINGARPNGFRRGENRREDNMNALAAVNDAALNSDPCWRRFGRRLSTRFGRSRVFLHGLVTLIFSVSGSAAFAQGGYTTEKQPKYGLTFLRARDYEAIPVEPTEEWVILYYAEKEAFRESDRKRFRPELRFVWIDHNPKGNSESTPLPIEKSGDESGGKKGEGKAAPKPVTDFPGYAERYLDQWSLGQATPLKKRGGNQIFDYYLDFKSSRSPIEGWARSFSDKDRTIAVFGFCAEEDYYDCVKIWEKMLGKVKFSPIDEGEDKAIRRFYERRKYSNPEFRINVRSNLVKGWEAEDTDNFIVVYSTKDEPLIRIIKRELESIRKEYIKLFPPARAFDDVSVVRVCKDEAEYLKYGGSLGSAGYWHAAAEELVFYDKENEDGEAGTGKADTRIVLYHEAFHQYIYFAVGKLAPHSWFNEGTGDYFSGALIKGGKVKKIDVNPWRIDYIKYAIEGYRGLRTIPFSEILKMEQADFYNRSIVGVAYSQAWSMIYFLRTSKEATKHPTWSGILDTYFDTLKDVFAEQMEPFLKSGEEPTPKVMEAIRKTSRDAAVDKAFSDVNLRDLEVAWREYTLSLKSPK